MERPQYCNYDSDDKYTDDLETYIDHLEDNEKFMAIEMENLRILKSTLQTPYEPEYFLD